LSASAKRIRRTPEDARRLILDAAEASMAAVGPAGIRLQDVAAAAGVSHPTILHHFGSREGLIRALNLRTLDDLHAHLLHGMADHVSSEDPIGRTFAAYRNGLAQRMMWLMQSASLPGPAGLQMFEDIVQALHGLRLSVAQPGMAVDESDTRAIVHLTTLAAFGDAILGPRLRQASNADAEIAERRRFEIWFGHLINSFIASKASPPCEGAL
jgi:AcrR family transcriptional regulator